MAQAVRKVILYDGVKDTILDYFQIGDVILTDTEKGKELVKRLRLATGIDREQAEKYITELAQTGLVDMDVKGVLSTEDGELWFHLINEDTMRLDHLNNLTTQEAIMEGLRDFAKSDHDEKYVDGLSDEQVCKNWHFQLIVTEKPVKGDVLRLEEIRSQQPIGIIYDNHEKPYDLYMDGDCIAEFDFLDEAQEAYEKAARWNPDSVIDILSADGETSYMGQN